MTKHAHPQPAPAPGSLTAHVPTRPRHDGWTPEKQHDFIAALAESGCITEAAAAVGMSAASAYRLRARPDASHFRQAWEIALDFAVRRLSEAAFSRALNGVSRPIFYQGEQIGERRHYDERLTTFILRYRDPVRYGAWLDGYEARRHPDGGAVVLAHALNAVLDSAHGFEGGPAHGFEAEPATHEEQPWTEEGELPRALAEGPLLEVTGADRRRVPEGLSPEAAEMCAALYASLRRDQDSAGDDPATQDWSRPLTVLRPAERRPGG